MVILVRTRLRFGITFRPFDPSGRTGPAQGLALTIGACCLCYQEADWLAANIRWMYDRIDVFSVVIGPSDQFNGFMQPPDHASEQILRDLPDPDRKIRIYAGDTWASKDVMTAVATHNLSTDNILQLDADEFWPRATWDAALAALQAAARLRRDAPIAARALSIEIGHGRPSRIPVSLPASASRRTSQW